MSAHHVIRQIYATLFCMKEENIDKDNATRYPFDNPILEIMHH